MRHNFKNLKAWQKAIDLTDDTYLYCKDLPVDERFNLIDQINRSSCSIPANIAEGSGKRSPLQFAEYLSISLSSAYELETHLIICGRRNYGNQALLNRCLEQLEEIQKIVFSFRDHILPDQ